MPATLLDYQPGLLYTMLLQYIYTHSIPYLIKATHCGKTLSYQVLPSVRPS